MFHYDYKTENTCSQIISLDLDENIVHNVSFMGGCNGNLKAIPILIEGVDSGRNRKQAVWRPLRPAPHVLRGPAVQSRAGCL